MTARTQAPQTGTDLHTLATTPQEISPSTDGAIRTVDNVLDAASCAALIDRVDDGRWITTTADLRRPANGPHMSVPRRRGEPTPPCRLIGLDEPPRFSVLEDPVLALRLFYRLAEVLPNAIDGAQLVGLKPILRCVRLAEGQGTETHHDPVRECSAGMHSHLSVVVFLNDDFSGGGLEFPSLGRVVEAKLGRAVVFPHELLHRDVLVQGRDAFVLQGEVFYSNTWQPMR